MTLLYFLIAISLLVVIHEFGHFWVARRCGVYVKRFSVGFGKPLWSFKDRQGTEFAIAPIPLGGYVAMLDEREGEVPPERLHQAYNRKSPWQRIAIASAGPVANFLFAIAAYWFLFASGTTGLAPVVGAVEEGSPAYQAGFYAGDEILAVGEHNTATWEDVNWQLVRYLGDSTQIPFTLKGSDGSVQQVQVSVQQWLSDAENPDPIASLGLAVRTLSVPAKIREVQPEGAGAQAGIQIGDTLIAVNGEAVADWFELTERIMASPNQPLQLEVQRAEQQLTLTLTPASRESADGKTVGFAGLAVEPPVFPEDWLRKRQLGVVDALWQGITKTYSTSVFTLESLWKMLKGMLSVKNLSGPVSIAKVAGASAQAGLESFISFLALLSISLGVLNLLPVPMLDGGHILFCLIEVIKGKPLSEQLQTLAVKAGLFVLLCLMLVAFYNDLGRL